MRALRLPAFIVLLLLVLQGAGADAGQMSDAVSVDGPAWYLFDYVPGSGWSWILFGGAFGQPAMIAAEAHPREAGTVASYLVVPGRQVQVMVDSQSATIVRLPFMASSGLGLAPNGTWGVDVGGPVVLYSANAGEDWSWSTDLAPGASLTLVASGTDVLYSTGRSPDGGHHAHLTAAAGASVSMATYEFEVEHRFLGLIAPGRQVIEDSVRLVRPDGSSEVCPCEDRVEAPWLAGQYAIEWNGIAVGDQELLLAGIDIDGIPIREVPTP